MKDASMSLGIYFEIKDAELYGGEGTTGYAATNVEISIEGLQNADFEKYANSQLEAMPPPKMDGGRGGNLVPHGRRRLRFHTDRREAEPDSAGHAWKIRAAAESGI